MSKIAVLGQGVMGTGMAKNLALAGHEVMVWNRTPKQALAGTVSAPSIEQAVTGAQYVLYCLSNDQAVEEVVFGHGGVLQHVSPETTVIDLSTISPELSLREHTSFAQQGIEFLDSPVFGSRGEAQAGGLWIVVGGDAQVFEHARGDVYVHISETVHYMGEAGNGARMKLVGNLLVASQLQALGEALTFARAAGLDLQDVIGVLDVTDFKTPIYSGVGRGVIEKDYSLNFALKLMAKDLGLMENFSKELGVSLPTAAVVQASVKSGLERGYGDLNASALILALSQDQHIEL